MMLLYTHATEHETYGTATGYWLPYCIFSTPPALSTYCTVLYCTVR